MQVNTINNNYRFDDSTYTERERDRAREKIEKIEKNKWKTIYRTIVKQNGIKQMANLRKVTKCDYGGCVCPARHHILAFPQPQQIKMNVQPAGVVFYSLNFYWNFKNGLN